MNMRAPAPEVSPTATCLACGYSLRGLPSHVCPECGLRFDPANPMTFDDPQARIERRRIQRMRRWERWQLPPSRGWCAFVVLSAVALFVMTDFAPFAIGRDPQSFAELAHSVLYIPTTCLLSAAIFGRFRALYARRRLTTAGLAPSARYARSYTSRMVWACACIGLVLIFWPLTLSIRFACSRTALQEAAEAQLAEGTSLESARRIGLLRTNGIYLHNGGQVFFNMTGWNGWVPMGRRAGLLYEPRGRAWPGLQRAYCLDSTWSIVHFNESYTTLWDFFRECIDIR
jgi:hypothetical protein